MAILKFNADEKPRIDLSGEAGNAFALLGLASRFGKDLGFTPEKIKSVDQDMRSGDYDHLIAVFDEHFGDHVDLVLPPGYRATPSQPRKPRGP